MPFTPEALSAMLAVGREATVVLGYSSAAIGKELGLEIEAASALGERTATFEGGTLVANTEELVFERASENDDRPLTHFFVLVGPILWAVERLDRPIMLRRGERATIPAGGLRLRLRTESL